METSIDFLADWKHYMQSRIVDWGHEISSDDSFDAVSYRFFNIENRRIESRPRKVHEAVGFSCPQAHSIGYGRLRAALQVGEDVNPYLSRSLLKPDYSDPLLNDWRIHHFHLGDEIDDSGFVARTGPLLFAMVFRKDVLCIAVMPHGSWSKQMLVETVHRNWPQAIEPYRLKGVLGLSRDVSDDDIAFLRKGRVNTFVEIEPGVVYGMIVGGYSTAGTSCMAQMQSMKHEQLIIDLQAHVVNNIDIFLRSIESSGKCIFNKSEFRLHVNDEGFYAVETVTRTGFLLLRHEELTSTTAASAEDPRTA